MATLRKVYVDTDVVGGAGDGSSWANAYSSLNAAEQAQDDTGDLVSRDEYIEFDCRGATNADTAAVIVTGWTTDATRYIHVYTEAANRHDGKWNTAKYRLSITNAAVLQNNEAYLRLEGLQITSVSPTGNSRQLVYIGSGAAGETWIAACLLQGHAHGSYLQQAVQLNQSSHKVVIWNSIIYAIAAITSNYCLNFAVGSGGDVYSCTAIGGEYALRMGAGTATVKNTYCGGSLTEDFYRVGGTLAKTNCASEDQSADDTSGSDETASNCVAAAVAVNTTNFTNVSAGTEDFHLPLGSALIDVGTNTSGDSAPLNFTTDIDGQTRSGTWDIGADEYVSAATSILLFLQMDTESLGEMRI